jgi:hypothetical protein
MLHYVRGGSGSTGAVKDDFFKKVRFEVNCAGKGEGK